MEPVTVERKELAQVLGMLKQILPKKLNIPVLGHVRMVANGDVELAATDLECGAVLRIPRKAGKGAVTTLLPGARLSEYVRKSKREDVNFEIDGNLTSLDGSCKLVGLDPADYPKVPEKAGPELAAVLAGPFAEAIETVAFAVSTEVVRYALTGVLFHVWGDHLHVVASDGKRLASCKVELAYEPKENARIIVPLKTARLLARLARAVKPFRRIVFGRPEKTQTQFRVPAGLVYTRLVEGHFPDYEAVTPNNLEHAFTLNRAALTDALAQVLPMTTDKTKAVRFTFGGGKLALFTRTQDVGEGRAEMTATGKGEAEIVLNPDYVLDYLKACPKLVEAVTVKFRDKTTGTVWSGPKGHTYVLMPLTVDIF